MLAPLSANAPGVPPPSRRDDGEPARERSVETAASSQASETGTEAAFFVQERAALELVQRSAAEFDAVLAEHNQGAQNPVPQDVGQQVDVFG